MTYFKVACGYECGGPEDGMMCRCYESIIQASTKQEAENTVWEQERFNPMFIGCNAKPASAEEIKEWFYFEHTPLPF